MAYYRWRLSIGVLVVAILSHGGQCDGGCLNQCGTVISGLFSNETFLQECEKPQCTGEPGYGDCSRIICSSARQIQTQCPTSDCATAVLDAAITSLLSAYTCSGFTPSNTCTQSTLTSSSTESGASPPTTHNLSTATSSIPTSAMLSLPTAMTSRSSFPLETTSGSTLAASATSSHLSPSAYLPHSPQSVGAATQETASSGTSTAAHADISPTQGSSKPVQRSTHLPIATIASAAGGAVLLFVLVAGLFLSLRRLKRRGASTQSVNAQRQDDGSAPPSTSTTPSTRRSRDNGMKRPGTPWEAPREWDVITRALPQDILVPSRAITPNPHGASLGSSSEERPLLRHSTASSSLAGSAVHSLSTSDEVEHGGSSATLGAHVARNVTANGLIARPLGRSWGSDGDTVVGDVDEAPIAETSGVGWHSNMLIRPPPSSYNMRPEGGVVSSRLARRRDSVSYTYESGETGMAL
ncbi:hypothetical protein C8Q73DRAFT_189837 [Cubamyces lactineus]|nr:hypothetical protein C8Q73DRAFT_189837 [Cubamyces lactineus]